MNTRMVSTEAPDSSESFLAGGGEMGQLIRSKDWATTPLGPIETWPQSLRTSVSLCLSSTFPILIAWGPETIQLYNDSYRPICGAKHPESMGQNFRICWETALPVVGDAFTRGQQGQGTYIQDQRMFLDRYGYLEETFMTFSFAPIRDESGQVGGIFHPITESTDKMLSARRTQVLRDVATRTAQAKSQQAIYDSMLDAQSLFSLDLPFLLFYALSPDGQQATLVGSCGLLPDEVLPADLNKLTVDATPWLANLDEVRVITELNDQLSYVPAGPYPETPHTAVRLPITLPSQDQPIGFVLAGVSSRRALDADYQTFYDLLCNTFNTAFSNVHAYQQEQQRAEALAAIDRAKTAFFSNVSHEFRTPLTLMLGPLDELRQQLEQQPASIQAPVIAAHRNALRLLKLVNNLLDFSRIEAGRTRSHFQPVELAGLTQELASNFRSLLERAGLQLIVDCQPLPSTAYVDREMWEKIVLNLLSNAFKFTLQGSIQVSLTAEDEQAVLAVTDTGVGIPAAELPHMFERFHRVENAGGRSFEGSGIGLSLVQELVHLHGGTISVSSVEGVGSTFTIRMPLGRAHLPAAQVSDDLAEGPLSALADSFLQEAMSMLDEVAPATAGDAADDEPLTKTDGHVLVVDDNADMRAYLTRLLSPYFTVHTAVHGADALDQLRTLTPQLILSDVMMPVMDGKELIRRLRLNPATALIPLIFLSARAGQEARIDGLEAGADDYLVKPFSAAELLTKVRAQISLEALRRSSSQAVAASEARYRQLAEELDEQVRQRTAELETLVIRLQRSNEYLQQFAYVASHDLQEPLRKIQQFSDLLQGRLTGVAGEKEVNFLTRIQVAAARMSTLIRALLTYSQLDNAEPERQGVALTESVSAACDALEISLNEADAHLDIDPLPTVWGHYFQLSQLFQNLLSNALKFRHPGQAVHIQIRCTEVPTDTIPPSERPPQLVDSYYRVDVIDNGIGFDEKYQSRIFQVFQRLHTKGEYEGTGIGLAICQRIAINHGGFITARSQPDQGATFSVYLPAQPITALPD